MIKIGDTIKLKKRYANFILSEEGQNCYFPPSGVLSKIDYKDHYYGTLLALLVNSNCSPEGIVLKINYPKTEIENYEVVFDLFGFFYSERISKEDLMRVKI